MSNLIVPGIAGMSETRALQIAQEGNYELVFLGDVTSDDIACGQAYVDNDVCIAVIAMVGQVLRALPSYSPCTVGLIDFCPSCESGLACQLLENACSTAGLAVPETVIVQLDSPSVSLCDGSVAVSQMDAVSPYRAIGIVGPAPIVYTPYFSDVVVQRIIDRGFVPVFADPAMLNLHDRYFEQAIEKLYDQGIRNVACLVPFGCLYGQVWIRGRRKLVSTKHTDMTISYLDIEPQASDLNLINRLELMLESCG